MNQTNRLPERNSNFELLRIGAMLMIVVGHLYKFWNLEIASEDVSRTIIYPWFMTNQGVDIFILISGFFGINVSYSKLIGLWLTVVYYGLISALICYQFINLPLQSVIFWIFRESSIISSRLWFVSTYFALMIFAPLINTLFSTSKRNQLYYCIIFFIIDTVFQTRSPQFYGLTTWGGALLHFISLYILGRLIFIWNKKLNIFIPIVLYIISTFLGFVFWDEYCYSGKDTSIWIIFPSVCLIFIFQNLPPFYNKIVNWVSKASFGVYCFHALTITYISTIITPMLSSVFAAHGNYVVVISVGIAIIIYILTLPLDLIRRYVCGYLEKPILKFINYINSKVSKLIA